MRLLVALLLLLIGTATVSSTDHTDPPGVVEETPRNESTVPPKLTWDAFMRNMTSVFSIVLHKMFPHMVRASSEVEVGPECMAAYFKMFLGLRKLKGWAVRLVDASGKPPDGLLEGTLAFLGAYDECLDTVVYDENDVSRLLFRGKYCTAQVAPKWSLRELFHNDSHAHAELASYLPKKAMLKNALRIPGSHVVFRVGLCVPSTCAKGDIEKVVKYMVKHMDMKAEVTECQVKESKRLTPLQIVVIVSIAIFFLLAIVGTILDIILRKRATATQRHNDGETVRTDTHGPGCAPGVGSLVQVLLIFSIRINRPKVRAHDDKPGSLGVLHGIRFLSMAWIVFGHSYFFVENVQPFRGLFNGHEMYSDNFFFSGIINFTLGVDSFFLISGLLVVYTTWRELEQNNGRLNVVRFLFNKYWRMTPPLLLSLGLLFLMPALGDGPFWNDIMGTEVQLCERAWWSNLLYINNFWESKDMCLVATWYLACNYQFFVVSVLILVALYNWPKIGLSFTFLLLVAGSVASGVITFVYNLPPGLIFYPDLKTVSALATYVYHKPYNHIGSFCVGIYLGYLVVKFRNVKLKPLTQVTGWCTSFAVGVAVLWAAYRWNSQLPTASVAALYAATHRVAWCIALGWLIFACITGHGGFVQRILSWEPFSALGSLAYMAYLTHPLVMLYHASRTRDLFYYSQYEKVYAFFGHFLTTLFVSTVFYVVIESPCTRLGSILLSHRVFKPLSPRSEKANGAASGRDSVPPEVLQQKLEPVVLPAVKLANTNGTSRKGQRKANFASYLKSSTVYKASVSDIYHESTSGEGPTNSRMSSHL